VNPGIDERRRVVIAVVVTENLSKQYNERFLWEGLNLRVKPGDVVAVRGESGSGKTTLLHCLGGLESFGGSAVVSGVDVAALTRPGRRRYLGQTVSFLFQNYGLVDNWTVAKNLDLVRRGRGRADFDQARREALAEVGLPPAVLADRVFRLSGGEQQRVALARVVLKGGALIMADEPTSALDDGNAERLTAVLERLAAAGAAVLVATHDPRVIRRCSQEIVLGTLGGEDIGPRAAPPARAALTHSRDGGQTA
jgi:putative ABC transport system ATP-binding protein